MPRETPTYALLPCALCQFETASGDDIVISSCFHSACLDMVDLEDELYLLRFVEAMRYKRQPNLLQKEMRRHHLITCLSAGLLESFAQQGTHLPLELWNKIAEHLLPHYASANARSLWRRIKPEPVRMTEDIWCKYVDFEGIRYITKLSNSPSDGWELIYRPSGESIKYIFTAENHLGVISLLFSTSSNEPQVDEAPGIWWRTVHVKGEDLALRERIDACSLLFTCP
ncbi:uncharacterized protein TRIVIDRAFT_40972 [Trichoderma virens Gv29-8]|uniref:Uncharacterized protein n=1 Tax=Hypocrea virens (strain Gv29-8 / FGSC 10586) TaxID=413071 RepID=G9NAB4_HYPVG|nr:uncharacterized protein TRIVIDRAFT_40972 [Trichoderma virens Gv29-8]EHK16880.1 hypothetical protein TRIVIDRAFT_40972 [Trichoderma virens Gv29-8]UKZ51744.1 hypothetical protein TrVGV298_005507 [Trichoderma virens]